MASPRRSSPAEGGQAIAGRLEALRRRIAEAALAAGRRPEEVALVAVSKRQPVELIAAAFAAGQRVFGENRVQEAAGKIGRLPPEAEWHLIGPLQSNKVKTAAGLFAAVHSVDRSKIALALDRERSASGAGRLPILLEVHLGGEESKHGFDPATLVEEAKPLFALRSVEVAGLMCIPPYFEDPHEVRPFFHQLRELRDRLAELPDAGEFRGLLSMGMSHDFEVAIAEGATHVRVGTALFGERQGA
jgi:pyridoxal phosphate enzyme (YggS family)